MNHIHAHRSLLVFAILVTVLVIGLNFYMHYAVGVSINRASLARDIVVIERANLSRERELSDLYQLTAADRGRLRGLVASSTSVVTFIEAVEAIGRQASTTVTISSIDADNLEGATPGTIGMARSHVQVEGFWPGVMRSIELAEVLPYPATINNISLLTSGGDDSRRRWAASFDVQVPIAARAPANK